MKIDYMREYIELVKNLNFTNTADKLYITQPALSRHISTIEKEFGVQLFYRDKRNVCITKIGEYVFEEFQRIVKLYDHSIRQSKLLSAGLLGEIKIGMSPYSVDKYYNPLIRYFKKNSPGIQLSLFTYQPSDFIISSVLNDEIDIGHVFATKLSKENQLCGYKIYSESLVAMISDEHSFASRDYITLSDFKNEKIIKFSCVKNFSDDLEEKLFECGVTEKNFICIDIAANFDAMLSVVQETGGILIVPNHLKLMKRKNISFVDIKDLDFINNSYFVYKKNAVNPAIHLFLDYLDEHKSKIYTHCSVFP